MRALRQKAGQRIRYDLGHETHSATNGKRTGHARVNRLEFGCGGLRLRPHVPGMGDECLSVRR
jgi:hypothetical protein